jgi:hypothetical protein
LRLVINQAEEVSNIALPMFKMTEAVQIITNVGCLNAPRREEGTSVKTAEEFGWTLMAISGLSPAGGRHCSVVYLKVRPPICRVKRRLDN